MHCGEAADRGGARPGKNRFALLEARFAEVGVQVDEAGEDGEAVGIDDGRARAAEPASRLGDAAVLDDEVDA